jgi:uncharacterized phage protein gp47/JayE
MPISALEAAAAATPAQVLSNLLGWLSAAGLPATAWQENSVPRKLLEAESIAHADALNLVAAIANGDILELSAGEWLTQLAANRYDLTRKFALPARGPVLVTNNSGSPLVLSAGQLLVRSTQTLAVFRNLDAATIADGATVELAFQADEAGLSGNCAVGTVTAPVTAPAGVTFDNPGAGGVWLTQVGTREESDDSLRIRCRARFPALGVGPGPSTYQGWALSIDQVTQARVFPNSPVPGKARIIVAGDSNPLDAAVVIAVDAFVQPIAGMCIRIETTAAAAYDIPINATVYVTPAHLATAAVAADAAVRELIASKKIGEPLYVAEIVEAIMASPGAGNATVSLPTDDVAVPETAILSLLTAPIFTVAPLPALPLDAVKIQVDGAKIVEPADAHDGGNRRNPGDAAEGSPFGRPRAAPGDLMHPSGPPPLSCKRAFGQVPGARFFLARTLPPPIPRSPERRSPCSLRLPGFFASRPPLTAPRRRCAGACSLSAGRRYARAFGGMGRTRTAPVPRATMAKKSASRSGL